MEKFRIEIEFEANDFALFILMKPIVDKIFATVETGWQKLGFKVQPCIITHVGGDSGKEAPKIEVNQQQLQEVLKQPTVLSDMAQRLEQLRTILRN